MKATQIKVYECGICKKVYFDEKIAEDCCKNYNCEDCGVEIPRYRLLCDTCSLKRKFEKAEKLTKWDGWVYWEGLGYNEGYFRDIGELIEHCEDEGIAVPDWVFTCTPTNHKLDIKYAIEIMLDDAYEDAYEGLIDLDELEEFIDKWNAKQRIVTYYPNYKKILLVKK